MPTQKRLSEIASETQILTVQQVASRLSVDRETVRRYIRRGDLQALPLGGSAGYRITGEQLANFENRLLQRGA